MGDWAKKAAAQLEQRETYQREAAELASRREGRIRSEAPYLWDALKEELGRNVREFSTIRPNFLSIEPLIQHLSTVKLRSANQREIHITFDGNVPLITFTLFKTVDAYASPSKETGKLTFTSDQEVSGVWLRTEAGVQYGISAAAEYFLNMLV